MNEIIVDLFVRRNKVKRLTQLWHKTNKIEAFSFSRNENENINYQENILNLDYGNRIY